VAGPPPGAVAVLMNAIVMSNASRADDGVRCSCDGNGDELVTAVKNRSGVLAQRSTSRYCTAARPMRSRSRCSIDVRPVPHLPG
jgi:hypothetical protein